MKFEEMIKKCGYDPRQFHKVCGLERVSIYNYRTGKAKPNLESLKAISTALNKPMEEVSKCFE